MNKITRKILSTIVLSVVLTSTTAFADTFNDLESSHKNFDAITYLQENGILQGYGDGTFKPERAVNRAEFLKIIIEGSNIPTDIESQTPFKDVNHSAWYGKYIQKAYAEGWIEGYEDGTFKPEKTINKVEALKILAMVQNWALPQKLSENPFKDVARLAWFAKYVTYAKSHEFLEEQGENFEPGQLMTRANISEVIYRTITTSAVNEIPESTTETPSPEPIATTIEAETKVSTNFTPVKYETIPETFFEGINLDESLPNTFYQGEIYMLKGTITKTNYDTATVFMEYKENKDTKYKIFNDDTNNNAFEIPLFFDRPGNYYIGVIPGKNGSSNVTQISVMPSIPEITLQATAPEKAKSLDIKYKNDKTYVKFNAPQSTFKKLTFVQGTKAASYYSRQSLTEIPVYYSSFDKFNATTVSYSIETAHLQSTAPLIIDSEFTKSSTETFKAIEHTFSEVNENKVTANPPEILTSITPITFSGNLKTNAKQIAYIIKPDGFVNTIKLQTSSPTETSYGSSIIKSGGSFQYSYIPETTGRYIVEISDEGGIPIINHPVYIGGGIPLLPDYEDLNQRDFFTGTLDLSEQRNELLNEINKSRKEHGLEEVSLETDLSKVAQLHAEDMAKNNYFSHINAEDKSPSDRAKEGGIATPVSENIARDVSIEFGHYGLMRSASHRENILNSNWTEVGIGVALAEGYLYLAEEFSYAPLTASELAGLQDELFQEINQLRTNEGLTELIYSESLKSASIYLNDKVIIEGESVDNALFAEALASVNVNGSSQAIGRMNNSWPNIKKSILTEELSEILSTKWDTIGIDLQLDNKGYLHTIIIINHQEA